MAKSVGVGSDKPSGTVTAQDPPAGTSLVEGATVRINYSTGPKQVAVPAVVGLDYSAALQQLQAAGFAVARTDVESDQPAGVVVSQVPAGSRVTGALAPIAALALIGRLTATIVPGTVFSDLSGDWKFTTRIPARGRLTVNVDLP